MRHKDESKFRVIQTEINRYFIKHGRYPTQRELSVAVGLCQTATCSYIKEMRQRCLLEGEGRYIATRETKLIAVPVVDSLMNFRHNYDEADISDYIFISRRIYGEGEFGIVRAVDGSMLNADIKPNNHIIIKRQKVAEYGQIILAKIPNKYVLRRYVYDERLQRAVLMAESECEYGSILDFEIRGVAISTIARF